MDQVSDFVANVQPWENVQPFKKVGKLQGIDYFNNVQPVQPVQPFFILTCARAHRRAHARARAHMQHIKRLDRLDRLDKASDTKGCSPSNLYQRLDRIYQGWTDWPVSDQFLPVVGF